ncbi:MAG TPA: ATP-grasp domain-containing protein [Gemmatimonadales bacterium]|nr:ATP-grasp domain-containing protein [Gemmatimonadales bacterium]
MAGGSRCSTSETLLPDPATETNQFVTAVADLLDRTRALVLLPVTDPAILAVLENETRFSGVRIPMADLGHFLRASDKEATLALAERIGIETPHQWVMPDESAPVPGIPQERFPVVLKPSRSVRGSAGKRTKLGVSYAGSPVDLERAVANLPAASFPLLIQARITGPGIGIFLLRWEGAVRAVFAHRRIREFPPSGGVSVSAVSIEAPARLVEKAESLLAALDWSGVAMVEFKQDASSGRHFLMEINPRFWGSLQLAIDAGVDFPTYLIQLALGEAVTPVREWRVGIRSRWGWGEVDYLIARLRGSPSSPNLPPDSPGILRVVAQAATIWRPGQRGAVFRWSDPLPFVRESFSWFEELRG